MKILYLYSDTGGGHRASAKALIAAAQEINPSLEQKMVDVFAECSSLLNIFARMYGPMIKFSPKLWGTLYYWLNSPSKLKGMEKLARPLILKSLKKLFQREKPDLIISVHPMVNHLTVAALAELNLSTPFVIVVTDPVTLHGAWVMPRADMMVVATDPAKKFCLKYGMKPAKVEVLGLPIHPKFSRCKKISHPKFTVLVMGGGEGTGGGLIKDLVSLVLAENLPIKLIVICGRNQSLEKKLKARRLTTNFPLKIYGFTDKVEKIMAESDIIVTKAGPGSIAEAMALDLPMIINYWLPGQEEGNVDFVKKNKLGIVATTPEEIVSAIKKLMQKKEFKEYQERIKKHKKPNASYDIMQKIIKKGFLKERV